MPTEAEVAQIIEITVKKERGWLICLTSPFFNSGGIAKKKKKKAKNGQQEKGETVRILDNLPLDN